MYAYFLAYSIALIVLEMSVEVRILLTFLPFIPVGFFRLRLRSGLSHVVIA